MLSPFHRNTESRSACPWPALLIHTAPPLQPTGPYASSISQPQRHRRTRSPSALDRAPSPSPQTAQPLPPAPAQRSDRKSWSPHTSRETAPAESSPPKPAPAPSPSVAPPSAAQTAAPNAP